MITVLVMVVLIFALNFVVATVPAYYYDRPSTTTSTSTTNPFAALVNAAVSAAAPKKIYVGFFGSRIEYDVGSRNLDTIDLWKVIYPTGCSVSDMEDKTKALQGFWIISQISTLVLLIFVSIKVCCKKDFSHWWIFAANIFVFASIVIVSGIIGHQFNYELCGNRSINDNGFDLSVAAFFLFVNAVLLFGSQVFACLASCCYKEDVEPEIVVVHHQPDSAV